MVSFLLSVMALSGFVSFVNLKNIEVSVIKSDDIFALKPANLKFKARNRYFFGAFLLRAKLFQSEVVLPYIKGEEIFILNPIFPKRGKYVIKELTISSYFPFYFFRRSIIIPIYIEIIVFPNPIKCDISLLVSEGKILSESNISRGKSYEGEVVGVREYVQGDPLKYIHWKATAKTSSIKTKVFSPYQGNPVIVDINDFSGSLEEKIGKATYTLIEISKMGSPIGLKLEEELYLPEKGNNHLRRMLYALAVYNSE
ncbi:MAG: DUF58 domain-containing protein [Thermodesulfovibrio sp.]|nr:DUF58 domain-containing protein [Thermodesulfovibrio sp.]MCX7723958.1 DUF58 domain-containing protein [Thermodesulfovibrio sp.]MDW7972143.1 DUF58 domain-containing protein [Thermodesulfovibrio sp.]